MDKQIIYFRQGQSDYPTELTNYLGEQAPSAVALWGNRDILFKRNKPLLALFCSTKTPASIILQVHDLAQQWRTGGVIIISGFHSPVEQECLTVLLRGPRPVIVCPARSLVRMRLKREYKTPMESGRLLLISPFGEKVRRMTASTSVTRNRFVAALADAVLIAHAQPGSKTEQLAQEVMGWGKVVYMLDNPANDNLLALGAKKVPRSFPATTSSRTSCSLPLAMTTVTPQLVARRAASSLVAIPPRLQE
jgi:predicted Rossmann fold nucleotide-binding protein DprA/Smf involved in DNA uptake